MSDGVYSPGTVALRQREHQVEVQRWQATRMEQQAEIDRLREAVESEKQAKLRQQAQLSAETDLVRGDRNNVQHELSVVQRDQENLANREREVQKLEDLRRRNRTNSEAYIEDHFATLSPRAVVEHLTHSSPRVRKHAMDNVSAARFKAEDIAPHILPKLHQLISVPGQPEDSIVRFAENVISSPPMAKALARCGDCPRLADYLVERNQYVNQLAITALRQVIRSEPMNVKAAYDALAIVVPEIPVSSTSSPHPAVAFIEELTPKIIADCFNNGLWNAVSPLVAHRIDSIQRVALHKIVLEAQDSDRTRHGLVEANTLGLLDQQYQQSSPPPDVVYFFTQLVRLLADKMCRRVESVLWLLRRMGDPNSRINMSVLEVLRTCSMKRDPAIYDIFVQAEVLRRLNEPPTPPSLEVNALICGLLPILAVPHARQKQLSVVIGFLDHAESTISDACLIACKKVVESTVDDRACLYSELLNLNFTKASSLKLCDYAMPVFCKDWAASGDFARIAKLLTHTERRIRAAAHRVWNEAIVNTPSARAKIVRDDLLGVIFELCSSQYEDCIVVGYQSLPFMAIEIVKAGTNYARQLVKLLNHPRVELRRAALQGIQVVSEGSNANCEVLLSVEAFEELALALQTNPQDSIDTTSKILIRLAPLLSKSSDACARLLQLLDSGDLQVVGATRAALSSISHTNMEYRETLRNVILDRLLVASDAQIEFTALAIKGWIGPDLAQLNDFETFFDLVSHSNKPIQTAALSSLKQRMSEQEYQESLERANIIFILRSLSSSNDNPDAISFVAFALPAMALTLAHNNHVDVVLRLLACDEQQIREGAATAIENIANGSVNDRKHLLDVDILERLIGSDEPLGQTNLRLSSTIIPKLSLDYLRAGKVNFILGLVDHPQQHVRTAATRSVTTMVGGAPEDRAKLRYALLPRLNGPSPPSAVLREVAANSLSRMVARDMVKDGDLLQLFRLFENGDPRIRAPVIAELRSFIQASDETARRRIVDAAILPAILHAGFRAKDDLIAFTADCVLPILGPSFSQNDGGTSIAPLLDHNEPRIRTAAAMALRGVVDSRYGNVENMVKTGMISKLHSVMDGDDNVRDLWCHLLPKAAPFLSVRAEIEILFTSLGDDREIVRESTMEAIGIMAKTSKETQNNLFPTLMHYLDEPPDYALATIAQAISLSGFAFVSSGKEAKLLYIVEHGNPVLVAPAVDAIIELLSKGGDYEHRKLMEAGIFNVTLRFHQTPSHRDLSLKLLYDIISHLTHVIILKEGLAKQLLDLFDDPDTRLSQVLCQSLCNDSRVLGSSTFPLLPMLASASRMHNPSVSRLLRHWAPDMVSRLMEVRQVDIILKIFNARDPTVTKAYLQEIRNNAIDATEEEKDSLVDELQFVPALGNYLKSPDVMLRRISSEIVEILSNGSAFRSGRIMEEGIGSSLAWVAVNGDSKEAQHASINALTTLLSAAPDHANQLVSDSLPALCDILEDFHRSLDVHSSSLGLLTTIAQHSPWHRIIIESGITPSLVMWLSPQHSITDFKCKQFTFKICQEIAQKSDSGRKALIDDGILPVLLRLTTSHIGTYVVNACKIFNALAHSGIYREILVEAGAKKAMERIVSVFYPSTLTNGQDKSKAQEAAKQVLKTFKSTKNSTPGTSDLSSVPNSLRSRRSMIVLPSRSASTGLPTSAGMNAPTHETARSHVRWHVSESAADPNTADTMYQRDEVVLDGNRPPGPQNPRSIGHERRSTDPGHEALRTRPSRLTGIGEYRVVNARSQVHEDRISPPDGTDARRRTVGVTARASFTREPVPRSMNSPLGENSGRLGAGSEQGSEIPALSYYTARSTPGGEARSERRAGSSEFGTESAPSYHTMPVTSARPGRRTYRTT